MCMGGAVLLPPDKRAVMPRMPAPMVQQDGTNKNDCERAAVKRLIAKLRQAPPHLTVIVTEDSLRANGPHIELWQADGLHAIFGVKAGDQAFLFQPVAAAEHAGQVTSDDR